MNIKIDTIKKIYSSLAVLVLLSVSHAGTLNSAGTAAGSQLLIPQGSENIALSASNGASASGVHSLFSNPAGLASITNMSGSTSNGDYIADTQLTNFAFGMPLNGTTTIAAGIRVLDFGDIPRTTADATEGDGSTFSPSFYVAQLGLGRSISDRVRVGATGKIVSETMDDVSATALALDLGVQYSFPSERLHVGVALKNLGSRMQYSGTGMEQTLVPDGTQPGTNNENFSITAADNPLPTSLDISVGYALNSNLMVTTSFQNYSYQLNTLSVGAKYHMNDVWFGAGTTMNVQKGDQKLGMSDVDWEDYTESNWGFSVGMGANIDIGTSVLSVSYSLRQSKEYFDDYSSLEVSFSF